MKLSNLFMLNWRKIWLIVVVGFISIIIHNMMCALLGKEEVFFLSIVLFVLPVYFILSLIYTLIKISKKTKSVKKKRKKRK